MDNKVSSLFLVSSIFLLSLPIAPIFGVSESQEVIAQSEPAVICIKLVFSVDISIPQSELLVNEKRIYISRYQNSFDNIEYFGSGFIISSDGYIITNAHVVDYKRAFLNDLLLWGDVEIRSQQDLDYLDWCTILDELYLKTKFSNEAMKLSVIRGVSVNDYLTSKIYEANIVWMGDAINFESQKDFTILKIEAEDTLPILSIGDSSKVNSGDPVYILGFPYLGGATTEESGLLIPTATDGIISAIKEMDTIQGPLEVIQTNAEITGGNSGGPACNSKGEVIGITTYSGEEQGFNFLLPINLAIPYLTQFSIRNEQTQLDILYQEALELFWNQHYSQAIKIFNKVLELSPGHQYATNYIKQAEEEIEEGNDITSTTATEAGETVTSKQSITATSESLVKTSITSEKTQVKLHTVPYIIIGVSLAFSAILIAVIYPRKRDRLRKPKSTTLSPEGIQTVYNPILTCLEGMDKNQHFTLTSSPQSIGRQLDNDIVINDSEVSRNHAKISYDGINYFIQDLNSTNGTVVNGKKISEKTLLTKGTKIEIGETTLEFTT